MKLVPVYVSEGVGGANGWVGGLGAFGGFVFPPLMGRLVDISPQYGYGLGFLLFTFFAASGDDYQLLWNDSQEVMTLF